MENYVKLFGQRLIYSTIWQESLPTKVTWITILAMMDFEGCVHASVPGLAKMAGVSIEECQEALGKFKGPDRFSTTRENGGRRIEDIEGGWRVLNFLRYRQKSGKVDRAAYMAEKQREYRARQKLRGLSLSKQAKATITNVQLGNAAASAAERLYERAVREVGQAEADRAFFEGNGGPGMAGEPSVVKQDVQAEPAEAVPPVAEEEIPPGFE